MNRIETFYALKSISPFQTLRDNELGVIVDVVDERIYPPQHLVMVSGVPFSRLLIAIRGGFETKSGIVLPKMIGIPSLLNEWPLHDDLYSAEHEETLCLSIQRGHFYTLINEFPSFLLAAGESLEPNQIYHRPTPEVS